MAAIGGVDYATNEFITAPARHAVAVTPDDNTDLTYVARSLYIGATGNVAVVTADGDTVTFVAVPVGILPVMVSRVKSTGTTATSIVALR